jgi:hypothetical protein
VQDSPPPAFTSLRADVEVADLFSLYRQAR